MAQQNSKDASGPEAQGDASPDPLDGRYQAEGYGYDPYSEDDVAAAEDRAMEESYDPEERAMRPRRLRFNIDQMADEWIDGLIPEEVEWRNLVRKYPRISVGLALVAGYLVGRTQGKALVAAAGAIAVDEISRAVEESVSGLFG
jgi:hypothetical protein